MSQNGNVYRAAIVGTGRIGGTYDDEVTNLRDPSFYQGENRHAGPYTILPVNHAASYQSLPGYELVAACNRSREKLDAFGSRYGISALYADYREMLKIERLEVVSVCTQSPEKAEITVGIAESASESGVKAIIVEKALATSMSEADAMVSACEKNGVILAVNHPYRFSPMTREARTHIDQGDIGKLGSVTVHASGGMMHIGTHTMDMLLYLAGADAGPVVEVSANVPNYKPRADLPARGMLKFANGITGFFDHTNGGAQTFEAHGNAGFVSVSTMVGDGRLHQFGPLDPEGKRPYPNRLTTTPIGDRPHTMSCTQRLLAELHDTLSTGASFISTGRDGAAALEICLACYASQVAGEPVSLPLADRDLCVPHR